MKKINEEIIKEASEDHGRRNFLKTAGVGALGVAGLGFSLSASDVSEKKPNVRTRSEKLKQMASNSYAVNQLFKKRQNQQRAENPETNQLKEKYRELTLLDFPQFTKDTYPGIVAMDIWSSLFGDIKDDSMFTRTERNGQTGFGDFDPEPLSSKRWLDQLANKFASTGTKAMHISNNAPRNIADLNPELRLEGVRVAKLWLDAAKQIGVKSMRVNTGGPQIIPAAILQGGYPRNLDIVPYLKNAIESFKEMADYGGKVGVKVTIENHWGLAANPMNIIIILREVNSPNLESSPDFSNWENDYLLYNGLAVLAPYAKSMIHAKRWTRYPDVDIAKCVQILNDCKYTGYISTEYEGGGDPVAGTLKLLDDVVNTLV